MYVLNRDRIKEALKRKKMSLEEFAKTIGKTKRSVYRWLSGSSSPWSLHRIARILEVKISDITIQQKTSIATVPQENDLHVSKMLSDIESAKEKRAASQKDRRCCPECLKYNECLKTVSLSIVVKP